MSLKLKRFSEGIWFDYPGGGRFKIRPLSPKNYLSIREQSKTGKVAVKKPDNSFEIVDDYDEFKFLWNMFCYLLEECLEVDVDGASNPEEIKEAIFNDRRLRDWITDTANNIYLEEEKRLKEELKNLKSSQSGSRRGNP